jgi:hypothetical protein
MFFYKSVTMNSYRYSVIKYIYIFNIIQTIIVKVLVNSFFNQFTKLNHKIITHIKLKNKK